MSATLTCWLNTSATKPVIWLKDKSGLIKSNPFLNLASKAETDILVDILREAYLKGVSYEVIVEASNIQARSNGSLSVKSTLAEVLNSMVETTRAEAKPVDESTLARANDILASLATRPVVATVTATDNDDFETF